MCLTLLTGLHERVYELAIALKAVGVDVLAAPDELGPITPGSVDCYIQLPDAVSPRGEDPVGWARAVLTGATMARFDAAARVGHLLGDRSRLLLVSESLADGVPLPDLALLRTLVEAAIDRPGRRVRVEVVDGPRLAADCAAFVRTGYPDWSQYAELEPDLAYADWRNEVMALLPGV